MQELEENKGILFILLAIVGGILGYINRQINLGKKLVSLRVLVAGLSSGFVGFLIFLISKELNWSNGATGAVIGITAWMGTEATIKILENYVYRKLNITQGFTNPGTSIDNPNFVSRLSDVQYPPKEESGIDGAGDTVKE